MSIGIVTLVALVLAAFVTWGGDGRPSLTRTLCGIPLALVGLSFPFLFEGGCDDTVSGGVVVTRTSSGGFAAHTNLAWCPKGCVNVPSRVGRWLTLPNGVTFQAVFTVEDPVALVRALHLDAMDHVVSYEQVQQAAEAALRPVFHEYLTQHGDALLHRALLQQGDLDATHKEIAAYLVELPSHRDPPRSTIAAMGLKFSDLCCAQITSGGS